MTLLSRLRALSAALALSFAATHAVAADLVIAGRDDIYGRLADAVAGFNKLHPGTEIELLAAEREPVPEAQAVDARRHRRIRPRDDGRHVGAEFIGNGWLKPLPASLADADLVPSAVALGRNAAGCTRCRSSATSRCSRTARTCSRSTLQPPRNWDDVLKIAQTVGGADKSVSGVVFRGTKGNPVVTGFLPILGLRRRRVRPCRQRDDRFA